VGLKPLGCVGDRRGMDGAGGVYAAGVAGAAPVLNIGGGFPMAAMVRARNGSVAGVVALVIRCCCGQVSTFRGGVGCCPGPKQPQRRAKSSVQQQQRSRRGPSSSKVERQWSYEAPEGISCEICGGNKKLFGGEGKFCGGVRDNMRL